MGATASAPMTLTEYMHPRATELVGFLPHRLGASIAARPALMTRLERWFSRGRHLETTSLSGFLQLYMLAALRRLRPRLLRHAVEMQHLEDWLRKATDQIDRNYALATGVLKARRLVKGYSDTHARGTVEVRQGPFRRVTLAGPPRRWAVDGQTYQRGVEGRRWRGARWRLTHPAITLTRRNRPNLMLRRTLCSVATSCAYSSSPMPRNIC